MATDKLNAMRVFRRVAELQSFSSAADDLDITAATVSKHIAFLENHLGTRLIHRTTRRMHLSDAGTLFLARTQAILDAMEDAELEAKGMQSAPQGRIKINVPMSLGIALVTEAIESFLLKYPDIQVDLQLSDHVIDLVKEGVDLAIRVRNQLPDSNLIAKQLRKSRNVVCASPDYLKGKPKIEMPSHLVEHNCLLYTLHDKPNIWVLGGEGIHVNGSYRADSSMALRNGVLNGLGIGFLPQFLVHEDIKRKALIPLLEHFPAPSYNVYAIFPPGRAQPSKVRLLVEHLNEHLGRQSYWE